MGGRRKPHHSHETTDAYAEGWDARAAWKGGARPINPYALIEEPPAEPSTDDPRKQQKYKRERERHGQRGLNEENWQSGWDDCDLDLKRSDLAPVTQSDFRPLSPEARQRLGLTK